MAQNYAQKYLNAIDERVYLDSLTMGVFDSKEVRLDFNGNNSVTIYNVNTVTENDYVRTGTNRFGALVELGTGTQTMVLSQDKSFTFSIDRGNYEDSMMVTEAAKAVKRQVREVSVPNTDIYNLSVLTAYAIANSQGTIGGAAVSNSNAYSLILAEQAALTELKYSKEGRILWITPTVLNLLKRDPEFKQDCDLAYTDGKEGTVGKVDGLVIKEVPASMLVTKFQFMITCKGVAVAVQKFNSVRTLDQVQGIDGWVVEGRRYHDCFILGQKATGIRIYTKA
ncbi:MAG: N4-gp56 family major capsid protein [Bacteroidota bacterium]|nr:N4-gp56 family major capsid protein [Bacteroidota bacterium]